MILKLSKISRAHPPATHFIATLGMVGTFGIISVNFVVVLLQASARQSTFSAFVLITVAFLLTIAAPLIALWGLSRGSRWAPILITLVGGWGCVLLLNYQDVQTWAGAGISVLAIAAVWMPSARKYAKDLRTGIRTARD